MSVLVTGDGHIYWVDSERRLISRIKRDLSGRETIVADGISGAESLAVDWIGGKIIILFIISFTYSYFLS